MKCVACDSENLRLRYRLGYSSIFQCSLCGHGTARLEGDATPELLNALTFGETAQPFNESQIPVHRGWARERLDVLRTTLAPGARLLEFGPGGGEFLWEADRAGYRIDAVDSFHGVLNANRPAGTQWIRGDVENYQGREDYDGVVAFHVLEHVDWPDRALAAIRTALRHSGVLLLEVPNYASSARHLEGARWSCFEPYHMHYFTPRSLSALCERAGFSVRSIDTCGVGGLEEVAGQFVARGIPRILRRNGSQVCTDNGEAPAPSKPKRLGGSLARSVYWRAVSLAQLPFRPMSAIERRLLLGGNLRILAERDD